MTTQNRQKSNAKKKEKKEDELKFSVPGDFSLPVFLVVFILFPLCVQYQVYVP